MTDARNIGTGLESKLVMVSWRPVVHDKEGKKRVEGGLAWENVATAPGSFAPAGQLSLFHCAKRKKTRMPPACRASTLTAATRVICLDRCYNPAEEAQAMAAPKRKSLHATLSVSLMYFNMPSKTWRQILAADHAGARRLDPQQQQVSDCAGNFKG